MIRILALAKITSIEGLRSRALMGVLILFFFALGLNATAAGFFIRGIAVFSTNLLLATISIAGLLIVVFICAGLMTKDIEKKTIQIFLTRPIRRSEYIIGKYLGMETLLFAGTALLTALSLLFISALSYFFPEQFKHLLWINFIYAAFFQFMKISVLAAILVFWGALASSSFIMIMLTIGVYLVGTSLENVRVFLQSNQGNLATLQFFEILSFIFPNLASFDFLSFAAYGFPFPYGQAAWTFLYALMYVSILLLLSTLIFRNREFN